MADKNKENGLAPNWVQDCQRIMKNWEEGNKESFLKHPSLTKSITFDPIAQSNLPQEIKDKMKADREKARNEIPFLKRD